MKYPTRQFTSDTRLMTAEGKWSPEAVLIYELMKRLADVTPHPEGIVVQNARARELVMDTPQVPEDGTLIIQVISEKQIRITITEPLEDPGGV